VPKRARDRRTTPLDALARTLDKVTGDGTCVASILPLVGLLMRCVRPCGRCAALDVEIERLRPEWAAAREAWALGHPETRKARPAPAELDEREDF
jgi:hypothetical protein